MMPGMGLRLEQRTVDSVRRALNNFLPHYFDYDYKYPEELHYTASLELPLVSDPWVWTVDFTKIAFE